MNFLQEETVQRDSRNLLGYFLVTLIILITVLKLSLMGSGFLAFPDETAYTASGRALKYLEEFRIQDAIESIFSVPGRPGETILKTIPNAVQVVTASIANINYYESDNSSPLFIYNFIIYCLLLFVHYKFSKFLFKESYVALVSVVLYSCLTNSYIYLRHAFPYDASLLIFYLVIYNIFTSKSDPASTKRSILLGICAYAGFLVYPGYFPLYILALTIFFFHNLNVNNVITKFSRCVYFVSGSIFCMLMFEGVSRLGGRSYLADSKKLSATITQGSFEESYVFIFKYLSEAEGLNGIFVIISLGLFFLIMIMRLFKKGTVISQPVFLIGISVSILFLAYASAGFFFHKMVLYGRLLHQYLPFICLLSMFAIYELLRKTRIHQILLFGLSVLFILNYLTEFRKYYSYSYPRDISWDLSKTVNLKDIHIECEYEGSHPITPLLEAKISRVASRNLSASPEVILVNSCLMYPVTDITRFHEFRPEQNYSLTESKNLFINFKAYQYEGYSIEERAVLDSLKLQLKVFKRNK